MNPSDLAKVAEKLPLSDSVRKLNLGPEARPSGAETEQQIHKERIHTHRTRKLTHEDHSGLSSTQPEPAVCHDTVGQAQGETENSTRFLIRITSYRKRFLDPDNLCPKYFIDCLRYAGIISDDTPDKVELTLQQRKIEPGQAERTEIEVMG